MKEDEYSLSYNVELHIPHRHSDCQEVRNTHTRQSIRSLSRRISHFALLMMHPFRIMQQTHANIRQYGSQVSESQPLRQMGFIDDSRSEPLRQMGVRSPWSFVNKAERRVLSQHLASPNTGTGITTSHRSLTQPITRRRTILLTVIQHLGSIGQSIFRSSIISLMPGDEEGVEGAGWQNKQPGFI